MKRIFSFTSTLLALVFAVSTILIPTGIQAQTLEIITPFQRTLRNAEGDSAEQERIRKMCFFMMPRMGNEENRSDKCGCNYESAPYGHYEQVTYACFSSKFNECMQSNPDPTCYNKACIGCLRSVRTTTSEPLFEELAPKAN